MRSIVPAVPDELRRFVVGQIVESDDVRDLSEDMVEIQLPNRILISAGWFASEPGGCYRVYAESGMEDIVEPFATLSADEAAWDVAELAARLMEF